MEVIEPEETSQNHESFKLELEIGNLQQDCKELGRENQVKYGSLYSKENEIKKTITEVKNLEKEKQLLEKVYGKEKKELFRLTDELQRLIDSRSEQLIQNEREQLRSLKARRDEEDEHFEQIQKKLKIFSSSNFSSETSRKGKKKKKKPKVGIDEQRCAEVLMEIDYLKNRLGELKEANMQKELLIEDIGKEINGQKDLVRSMFSDWQENSDEVFDKSKIEKQISDILVKVGLEKGRVKKESHQVSILNDEIFKYRALLNAVKLHSNLNLDSNSPAGRLIPKVVSYILILSIRDFEQKEAEFEKNYKEIKRQKSQIDSEIGELRGRKNYLFDEVQEAMGRLKKSREQLAASKNGNGDLFKRNEELRKQAEDLVQSNSSLLAEKFNRMHQHRKKRREKIERRRTTELEGYDAKKQLNQLLQQKRLLDMEIKMGSEIYERDLLVIKNETTTLADLESGNAKIKAETEKLSKKVKIEREEIEKELERYDILKEKLKNSKRVNRKNKKKIQEMKDKVFILESDYIKRKRIVVKENVDKQVKEVETELGVIAEKIVNMEQGIETQKQLKIDLDKDQEKNEELFEISKTKFEEIQRNYGRVCDEEEIIDEELEEIQAERNDKKKKADKIEEKMINKSMASYETHATRVKDLKEEYNKWRKVSNPNIKSGKEKYFDLSSVFKATLDTFNYKKKEVSDLRRSAKKKIKNSIRKLKGYTGLRIQTETEIKQSRFLWRQFKTNRDQKRMEIIKEIGEKDYPDEYKEFLEEKRKRDKAFDKMDFTFKKKANDKKKIRAQYNEEIKGLEQKIFEIKKEDSVTSDSARSSRLRGLFGR